MRQPPGRCSRPSRSDLAALPHNVEKADLGKDKGIYYRLQAGSFTDKKDAASLCGSLQKRAIECMVVESKQVSMNDTSASAQPTSSSITGTGLTTVRGPRKRAAPYRSGPFLFALLQGDAMAAVDDEDRAINVAAGFRRQQQQRAIEFMNLTGPAHRISLNDRRRRPGCRGTPC